MVGNNDIAAAQVIAHHEEVKEMNSPESGLMKLTKSDEE